MICESQNKLLPTAFALIFLAGVLANCAHAQTVDLSTDQAVLAELQKAVDAKRDRIVTTNDSNLDAKIKGGDGELNPNSIRIKRFKDVPEIIVIGSFRTEYGFQLSGVFVNSRYFEKEDAALSRNALAALGWEKAPKREREMLANFWVTNVCWHFPMCVTRRIQILTAANFILRRLFQSKTARQELRCGSSSRREG